MSDSGGVTPSDLAVDPNTGMAVAPNALLGAGSAWRAGLERTLADINRPMFPGGQLDLSHPMLGFAGPGSIKGFHGTPHLFEPVEGNPFGEFRNEAIGTGEGAQAYGYGHYVAGNPAVAKSYMPQTESQVLHNRQPLSTSEPHTALANSYLQLYPGQPDWIARTQAAIQNDIPRFSHDEDIWTNLHRANNFIGENADKLSYGPAPAGALLEVHILPDEHELLDWDKPLSQQSEGVQQAIDKFWEKHGFDTGGATAAQHSQLGGDFYKDISRQLPQESFTTDAKLASQALHEAGIPGIRYLDAGSRVLQKPPVLTQQGWKIYGSDQIFPDKNSALQAIDDRLTRNYVIFDPSNLRIIARNGQRLEPVDHNPFAESQGQ